VEWFPAWARNTARRLVTETVDRATLTLERIDDVEGSHSLALGVLAIQGGILDDLLEEDAEGAAGLVVDEAGQTLHATTTGHAADRGFGDALDVFLDDLVVALGARLAFAGAVAFAALAHTGLAGLAVTELGATDFARHDWNVVLLRIY